MHGQLLRFPYEVTTKIVEQMVLLNDIDSLRILSRFKQEQIQRALDAHILTVVINNNYDKDANYNMLKTLDGIPNHGQGISRTKLHVKMRFNWTKEQIDKYIKDSIIRYTPPPGIKICEDTNFIHSCNEIRSKDGRKQRIWVEFEESSHSIARYHMVIFEVHSMVGICTRMNEGSCLCIVDAVDRRNRYLFGTRGEQRKRKQIQWYHLQIFKPMPADIDACRGLLSSCCLDNSQSYPDWDDPVDFVMVKSDNEQKISTPLKLTSFVRGSIEKVRLDDPGRSPSQLVVVCPRWLYIETKGSQPTDESKIWNHTRRIDRECRKSYSCSTIDVFLYMNKDILRHIEADISEKKKKKKKLDIKELNKQIHEIIRLKKRELFSELKMAKKAPTYVSYIGDDGKLWERLEKRVRIGTVRALCFERERKLLDLFIEYARHLMSNDEESDRSMCFDLGYDSNAPFVCLGRFQVFNADLLKAAAPLDYGPRRKSKV